MVSIVFLPKYELNSNSSSCDCNIWFDLMKKPSDDHPSQDKSGQKKRKRLLDDDLSMVSFKNVKVANLEVAQNNLPTMVSVLSDEELTPRP